MGADKKVYRCLGIVRFSCFIRLPSTNLLCCFCDIPWFRNSQTSTRSKLCVTRAALLYNFNAKVKKGFVSESWQANRSRMSNFIFLLYRAKKKKMMKNDARVSMYINLTIENSFTILRSVERSYIYGKEEKESAVPRIFLRHSSQNQAASYADVNDKGSHCLNR